ncbi:hypothetical protein N1851_003962 [Merluccius polli]|uniref:Uncharacterized protein n=1 Tax=Merluccius polli TaxID=89951 RepID=A0AA47N932_MERPO|nr:hypothetical protein N1851_003962 [Merluccius polli]
MGMTSLDRDTWEKPRRRATSPTAFSWADHLVVEGGAAGILFEDDSLVHLDDFLVEHFRHGHFLLRSALVATVVPILIQPIREVSTGCSRGKGYSRLRQQARHAHKAKHTPNTAPRLAHFLQYSANPLCGSILVVLGVPRQKFEDPLATVWQPGEHIGEGAAPGDLDPQSDLAGGRIDSEPERHRTPGLRPVVVCPPVAHCNCTDYIYGSCNIIKERIAIPAHRLHLVATRIDYSNSILYGESAKVINTLQHIQNSTAPLLTHSGTRDHITPVLKSLHWLPVKQCIDFKLLSTDKALHNLAPAYLTDLLHPTEPSDLLMQNLLAPPTPTPGHRCCILGIVPPKTIVIG